MQQYHIVVPCYNEAERMKLNSYQAFIDSQNSVSFVFVNDGSKDQTASILRDFCRRNPAQSTVIDLPHNGGKAEAVRAGIMWCLKNTKSPHMGFCDADLSTPLEDVAAMVAIFTDSANYELIMGSRISRLGARVERSAVRHYLGRVYATAVSLLLNLPVYDSQCGAKVFKRGAAEIAFGEQFLSSWLFDVEILFRLLAAHGTERVLKSVYEYPLTQWCDIRGSKVTLSTYFKAPFLLMRIHRKYSKQLRFFPATRVGVSCLIGGAVNENGSRLP